MTSEPDTTHSGESVASMRARFPAALQTPLKAWHTSPPGSPGACRFRFADGFYLTVASWQLSPQGMDILHVAASFSAKGSYCTRWCNTPEDQRPSLRVEAQRRLSLLAGARIRLRSARGERWPNEWFGPPAEHVKRLLHQLRNGR